MTFLIYLVAGAVVITSLLLKSPKVKGWLGELRVNRAIKRGLDRSDYVLIKDVTIYDEEGTTQIDHLIVSRYGIFVIETKNVKGWIFGAPNQKKWTQSIYRRKFPFQNPVRQNYRHIKALESALSLDSKYFLPAVVFVGDCTLKTEMPENVFVGIRALMEYIHSVDQERFSHSEMSVLMERIEGIRLNRGHATNQLHIQNLKNEGKSGGRSGHSLLNVSKSLAILVMTVVLLLFFTQFNRPTGVQQTISEYLFPTNKVREDATQTGQTAASKSSKNPRSYKEERQVAPLYLIELKSGGSLQAKNIVRTKNTVAYEDGKGLITIINRADILKIKKLR